MSKMENTFAWSKNQKVDLSNYYNKPETNNIVNEAKNELNVSIDNLSTQISELEIDVNNNYYNRTQTDNLLNNKQNNVVLTTKERNLDINQYTKMGWTLDGKEIYSGVIVFSGSGESNLVNNCAILLFGNIYSITDNKFVSPESLNLRVFNNYQIRVSLPNEVKEYRLFFIGVRGRI